MEKKQMKEFMTVSLISPCAFRPSTPRPLYSIYLFLGFAHRVQLDVLEAGPEML